MAEPAPELLPTSEAANSGPLMDRLRRLEEALADQIIQRRLERDRIALLEVENEDLRETIQGLRRALHPSPDSGREVRRTPSRSRRR